MVGVSGHSCRTLNETQRPWALNCLPDPYPSPGFENPHSLCPFSLWEWEKNGIQTGLNLGFSEEDGSPWVSGSDPQGLWTSAELTKLVILENVPRPLMHNSEYIISLLHKIECDSKHGSQVKTVCTDPLLRTINGPQGPKHERG